MSGAWHAGNTVIENQSMVKKNTYIYISVAKLLYKNLIIPLINIYILKWQILFILNLRIKRP